MKASEIKFPYLETYVFKGKLAGRHQFSQMLAKKLIEIPI
jgi:hypothetical protein